MSIRCLYNIRKYVLTIAERLLQVLVIILGLRPNTNLLASGVNSNLNLTFIQRCTAIDASGISLAFASSAFTGRIQPTTASFNRMRLLHLLNVISKAGSCCIAWHIIHKM